MSIRFASVIACALAVTVLFAGGAFGEEEQQASPVTPLPKYRQECAACHIAYPPGMLPADSWRRILEQSRSSLRHQRFAGFGFRKADRRLAHSACSERGAGGERAPRGSHYSPQVVHDHA
jgi:hypothetical protein